MHTHDGSTFDNRVTLTFDLLISASIHADRLPYTVCLLSLVLTVLAVLERGQTDRHADITDATDHHIIILKSAGRRRRCTSAEIDQLHISRTYTETIRFTSG